MIQNLTRSQPTQPRNKAFRRTLTIEVLVDDEYLGVYSGLSGQISATTSNGLDQFIVDEEVSVNGVVTVPAMSKPSDDDIVFAELATGASSTINI